MRIAVYGAGGMIGGPIVDEARSRGHDVFGFTRSGGEGITVGEIAETDAFTQIAQYHDAVVIAVPPDRAGGPHEPLLEAFDGIIGSGTTTRILVIVGAGSLEIDGVRLVDSPEFPTELKAEPTTMGIVLDKLRAAPESLDWTAASPAPTIQPGERTGNYTVGGDAPVGDAISAEDFAVAVVDEIEDPRFRRARFTAAG